MQYPSNHGEHTLKQSDAGGEGVSEYGGVSTESVDPLKLEKREDNAGTTCKAELESEECKVPSKSQDHSLEHISKNNGNKCYNLGDGLVKNESDPLDVTKEYQIDIKEEIIFSQSFH